MLFDTLVQTVVPEDLIGRVTSSMATLTDVATSFGSLAGGGVAALVGPVSIRSLPPVATVERRDDRIEQFGERATE